MSTGKKYRFTVVFFIMMLYLCIENTTAISMYNSRTIYTHPPTGSSKHNKRHINLPSYYSRLSKYLQWHDNAMRYHKIFEQHLLECRTNRWNC
jgi:hypothetical protein